MPLSLALALAVVAIAAALATELYFNSDALIEQYFFLGLKVRHHSYWYEAAAAVTGMVLTTPLHIAAGAFRLAALVCGLSCVAADRGAARVSLAFATVDRKELSA